MTTTSMKNQNPGFLRSNYYNSVPRSEKSGSGRSAVELLALSKPYYVKSISVLEGGCTLPRGFCGSCHSNTRIQLQNYLFGYNNDDGTRRKNNRRTSLPNSIQEFQMERGFQHSSNSPFKIPNKSLTITSQINDCIFEPNDLPAPPLPPKSPRSLVKPRRPIDFPDVIPNRVDAPFVQPPPPPPPPIRRPPNHHPKLRRLYEERSIILPLPSPNVGDIESPMSDSGPIISPPPAFSTPVTPMLDKQIINNPKSPSSFTLPLNTKSKIFNKGFFDGSSLSSPSSSWNGELTGGSADDDSSSKSPPVPPRHFPPNKSLPPIPKSITENALCRVASFDNSKSNEIYSNQTTQTQSFNSTKKSISPHRRPLLRSKSDLSHRYKKSVSNLVLVGGGGLSIVPVDYEIGGSMDRRLHHRSSGEIDHFFDSMGLNSCKSCNSPLRSNNSSPVFFSSQSSIDSVGRRDSGESEDKTNQSNNTMLINHNDYPSIVERNARVIKWLFNCRKARENINS